VLDAVEASVVRRKWKAAKMQAKAKAQAKKMNAVDVALQTTLVESIVDLDGEIKSFGESKQALRSFLQDQYKWRL
jgi:3'-phosphoadenosine 5'-phosphosulfate (PAPS) 3'-phosphatase